MQNQMFTEEQLKKYIGVHNLAEQSPEPHERAAAGLARARLEEKYPGIGLEALRWEEKRQRAAKGETSPPPPPPSSAPPPSTNGTIPPGARPGQTPWGNWGEVLGSAFKAAQGFTETVINAEAGRQFAEAVTRIEENTTKQGMIRLTAIIPFSDLVAAKTRLNDPQKQAFARAVGERISARIYAFLVS